MIDELSTIEDYIDEKDWRVRENANTTYSIQGLNFHIVGKVVANYWLKHIFPENLARLHTEGWLHMHDLSMFSYYCAGWDLMDLIKVGFKGVRGKVESKPARHLSVIMGQMINFMYTMQNEAAGAVAFSNVDTLLAPYIYYDGISYNRLKQMMQEFIFNLNISTRVGMQSPFTNLSMDLVPPKYLSDTPVVIGGEEKSRSYGDFQDEMDMFNNAMSEIFLEGDGVKRPFTFPIPNYNITKDFDWETKKLEKLFEATAKYGYPYFSNYINSDLEPSDIRSMCLYPDEYLYVKRNNVVMSMTIKDLVEFLKENEYDEDGWADARQDVDLLVLSLNPHTGQGEWVKVSKVLKIFDNDLITVTLDGGRKIKMSKNHLVPYDIEANGNVLYTTAGKLEIWDMMLVYNYVINIGEEDITQKRHDDIKDGFYYLEIVDIKREHLEYPQVFYDIELEKNHLFIHSGGVITHNCCHLRLDKRQLKNKGGGGLFGAGALTGSVSVTTLNMPRIGYLSKDEDDYYYLLENMLEAAKEISLIRRKVVEENMSRGLYPYSKFYLRTIKEATGYYFDNHFSTIGLVGMNESCLNFRGETITSPGCTEFAMDVMDFMRDKLSDFQEETNVNFNLEATPAESSNVRLAMRDLERYPGIHIGGTVQRPYYTNSTMPPVDWTSDIFEFLEHQDKLLPKYTGGSVAHVYLGERVYSTEAIKKLIKTISYNFEIPYFTITPTFSICPIHGYIAGEHEFCPICDAELREKKSKRNQEIKFDSVKPLNLKINVTKG